LLKARPDLSPADFAQYTTLAPSTVRNWVNGGQWNGGLDVIDQMRRVLEQVRSGDILQPGGREITVLTEDPATRVRKVAKVGAFYQTQTVRRIAEVLDYCAENAAIGLVTADFGVGKTEGVKEYQRVQARRRDGVECVAIEFDAFCSTNKLDFVRVVAQRFGLRSDVGSQNCGLVFRDICEYLRKNPCLLIFDQCEMVRPLVCQVIRQIHDRTWDAGVGVAILGAPILLKRLMGGKMPDLEALTSRISLVAALGGLTRGEMAAIVKQEGFTDVDEAAYDLWFRACAGSMRRLMRSVALLKAKHQGKRIGEKTIAGVAGHLWGMNVVVCESTA
jgi:DNA transposition AAA+ family ATPase